MEAAAVERAVNWSPHLMLPYPPSLPPQEEEEEVKESLTTIVMIFRTSDCLPTVFQSIEDTQIEQLSSTTAHPVPSPLNLTTETTPSAAAQSDQGGVSEGVRVERDGDIGGDEVVEDIMTVGDSLSEGEEEEEEEEDESGMQDTEEMGCHNRVKLCHYSSDLEDGEVVEESQSSTAAPPPVPVELTSAEQVPLTSSTDPPSSATAEPPPPPSRVEEGARTEHRKIQPIVWDQPSSE